MAYLFDVFHNFLHSDAIDHVPEFQPDADLTNCFNLAVVQGNANRNVFEVESNNFYPVHNTDLILLQTNCDPLKERLCSAIDVDPRSVVSFYRKQKDSSTICYLLIQSHLNHYSESKKVFYYHDKMLSDASENIIKTIDRTLFEFQTWKEAEFYVQKVELAINNYFTIIKRHFFDNPEEMNIFSNELRQDLLKLYFRYLEIIQSHLELTYAVYRDQSKPVSRRTQIAIATRLSRSASMISEQLQKNHINVVLSRIILQPFQIIPETGPCLDISQLRFNYLNRFAEELENFFRSFDRVNERQLIQYLCVMNFNNIALLTYICDGYRQLKKEITDERSLIHCFQDQLNELNQLPQRILEPYNPDLKDLKKQVQTCIRKEIAYLTKSLKQKEKEQEKQADSQKLRFNHSVDVITSFFRLLYEAGITGSGANQTVRWINQNISSKNQLHISQQSIQRKFFDKYTNKEPLKNIIIHLLNHLNKT